ncbi:hypothetical protein FB451DRAFT_1313889 [Mycena latifolia]|nr:hypothetical protein FB451DRAFT_1313889 [Mycena latifolia]
MAEEDTRVEDLWFSNETLVIRAEKKLFRVSKSLLAARSTVFQDMVAFPQPAGDDDTEFIDGSPVVTLYDAATDVEVLLRAIFDSSYFMPPPEPVQLHTVLGILRLSHKYDIQYLFRRAVLHLSARFFPASAADYRSSKPTTRDHISYPPGQFALHLCTVIQAATEVGALWLLPVAYYQATSNYTREALLANIPEGAAENIVQKCMLAHADIIFANMQACDFLCLRSDTECTSRERCNSNRFHLISNVFSRYATQEIKLFPLESWADDGEGWVKLGTLMCEHCYTVSREKHRSSLEAFWDRLPAIYGLPAWPELQALRSAAMDDDNQTPT